MLKNAGVVPAWISQKKEITSDIAAVRADIVQQTIPKDEAMGRLEVINAKVRAFNMSVPVHTQQMVPLQLAAEWAKSTK